MELVAAPAPNAIPRPTTVDEWHNLAQLSTLFVPIAALANF